MMEITGFLQGVTVVVLEEPEFLFERDELLDEMEAWQAAMDGEELLDKITYAA